MFPRSVIQNCYWFTGLVNKIIHSYDYKNNVLLWNNKLKNINFSVVQLHISDNCEHIFQTPSKILKTNKWPEITTSFLLLAASLAYF